MASPLFPLFPLFPLNPLNPLKHKIMKAKKLTLLVAILICSFASFAQILGNYKQELPKSMLKIGAQVPVYEKVKIHSDYNLNVLKSSSYPSTGIDVAYYQHIYKGFGLNVGFGVTAFSTKIADEEIFYVPYYTVPITIEKVFQSLKSKRGFMPNIELGVKLTRNFSEYNYGLVIYDGLNFEMNSDDAVRCYANAKIGMTKYSRNKNMVRINCFVNFNPAIVSQGTYTLLDFAGEVDAGTLEQTMNCIGFEFIYGFSFR